MIMKTQIQILCGYFSIGYPASYMLIGREQLLRSHTWETMYSSCCFNERFTESHCWKGDT